MGSRGRSVALALVGVLSARPIDAQEGRERRSVEAAVADLQDGRVDQLGLFTFHRCPSEDPVGLAIFEATRDMWIGGYQQARLAMARSVAGYTECDYPPVDTWMLETFERLRREGDVRGAETLSRMMMEHLKPEVEQALLRAAEDPTFATDRIRSDIVDRIFRRGPREQIVPRAIEFLRRDYPYTWKHSVAQHMMHSFTDQFLSMAAAPAPSLPDDSVEAIGAAIMYRITDGELTASAPGVAAIRSELERRPNPPSWIGVLRGN